MTADPEFYINAIANMRLHWVDRAAISQGIAPENIFRALIFSATDNGGIGGDAEVRLNEEAKAMIYLGVDRIVDFAETTKLKRSEDFEAHGLVPDVPSDRPYIFFDTRLG